MMNLLRKLTLFLLFSLSSRFAGAALLVSSVMADPASYDNVYEYIEFLATERVDFSETPCTVIICNNGTILRPHGWLTGSTLTYAIQLDSGVVERGETFYVGGPTPKVNGAKSDDLHLTHWYGLDYTKEAGAGGIGLNQQWRVGMVGNGGPSADGVAIFAGRAEDITEESVPWDCVFYGDAVGDAAAYGYLLSDGSMLGEDAEIFPSPGSEKIMKFSGVYNFLTNEWEVARSAVSIPVKTADDIYTLIRLVPVDTVVVPPLDTIVQPADTVIVPPLDTIVPPIDTVVVPPLDTIVPPIDTVVIPPLDTLVPPIDTVIVPPLDTIVPPIDTVIVPPLDTIVPPIDTVIVPPLDTIVPPIDTVLVPPLDTIVPPIDTVIVPPLDTIVPPMDTVIVPPLDTIVPPIDTVVVPPLDTIVPPIDTVVIPPLDTIVTPMDTVIVPPLDTIVPPIDTVIVPPLDTIVPPIDTMLVPPLDTIVPPIDTVIVPPLDTIVPPLDTVIVPPLDTIVPPIDTVIVPPLDTIVPPIDTVIVPPLDTIVPPIDTMLVPPLDTIVPPIDTVIVPPLDTIVPPIDTVVAPPLDTLVQDAETTEDSAPLKILRNILLTPNGDGYNDTFVVEDLERYEEPELLVFNRWGIIVYRQYRYDNRWGGENMNIISMGRGALLPVGTYYYTLLNRQTRVVSGFIELSY